MPELDRGARTDGLTLAFDVGLVETNSSRTFDLPIDKWKICKYMIKIEGTEVKDISNLKFVIMLGKEIKPTKIQESNRRKVHVKREKCSMQSMALTTYKMKIFEYLQQGRDILINTPKVHSFFV